jgi:hypothetical protein
MGLERWTFVVRQKGTVELLLDISPELPRTCTGRHPERGLLDGILPQATMAADMLQQESPNVESIYLSLIFWSIYTHAE